MLPQFKEWLTEQMVTEAKDLSDKVSVQPNSKDIVWIKIPKGTDVAGAVGYDRQLDPNDDDPEEMEKYKGHLEKTNKRTSWFINIYIYSDIQHPAVVRTPDGQELKGLEVGAWPDEENESGKGPTHPDIEGLARATGQTKKMMADISKVLGNIVRRHPEVDFLYAPDAGGYYAGGPELPHPPAPLSQFSPDWVVGSDKLAKYPKFKKMKIEFDYNRQNIIAMKKKCLV